MFLSLPSLSEFGEPVSCCLANQTLAVIEYLWQFPTSGGKLFGFKNFDHK